MHWNLKSIEVTGYSDKEHLQMDILGLFADKDQEHISNRMIEVFTKGEASAEAELVTKLGDKIPYYFTGKRIEVNGKVYLSDLGTNISERKELEKKLEYLAMTDPLTGLCNRRQFFNLAEREMARARRYKVKISLLMLDIDHFKSINDTYGHSVGDLVLQKFPQRCQKILRDIDVIGRLGGEEFGILLPETDIKEGWIVAERLLRELAESEVKTAEGQLIRFTASIGIATLPEEHCDIDKLLAHADQALYIAKRAGRNRVAQFADIKSDSAL